jgi:hypothetical protein
LKHKIHKIIYAIEYREQSFLTNHKKSSSIATIQKRQIKKKAQKEKAINGNSFLGN